MPSKVSAAQGRSKRKPRDEQGDLSSPSKFGKTDASAQETWRRSKCSEKDLLQLVAEGLLQEKEMVQWCLTGKNSFRTYQ
jgi:hypothetical protein